MEITLTEANFEQEVLKSDKPVLIDFYAYWCGPCKMLSPIVDELAEEIKDYSFYKLNVDDAEEISRTELSITLFYGMKDSEVDYVVSALNSFK